MLAPKSSPSALIHQPLPERRCRATSQRQLPQLPQRLSCGLFSFHLVTSSISVSSPPCCPRPRSSRLHKLQAGLNRVMSASTPTRTSPRPLHHRRSSRRASLRVANTTNLFSASSVNPHIHACEDPDADADRNALSGVLPRRDRDPDNPFMGYATPTASGVSNAK